MYPLSGVTVRSSPASRFPLAQYLSRPPRHQRRDVHDLAASTTSRSSSPMSLWPKQFHRLRRRCGSMRARFIAADNCQRDRGLRWRCHLPGAIPTERRSGFICAVARHLAGARSAARRHGTCTGPAPWAKHALIPDSQVSVLVLASVVSWPMRGNPPCLPGYWKGNT